MSEEEVTGAELVPVAPAARAVDLRNHATDSWTDVLADVAKLSRGIASTEFVPKSIRCTCGNPLDCACGGVAKTSAAVLYSRELGLPPMTGLGQTHVIEGTAGISAELMRALILQAGHELVIEVSNREVCTIKGRRSGDTEWTTATWTIQEARITQVFLSKAKGWGPLASKAQWVSWPAEMLLARATTRLARMVFPDVIHGMRTVEEIRDMVDVEDVPEGAPTPEAPAPVRRKRARKPEPVGEVGSTPEGSEGPALHLTDEPPERKRPARPAPRKAPEPEPGPPTPPAEDVVDAELVEDQDEPVVAEVPADAIKPGQRNAIMAHFARLKISDRDERLMWLGLIVGREIGSANVLTTDEAGQVLDVVDKLRDRDALEQWGREKDEAEGQPALDTEGGESDA